MCYSIEGVIAIPQKIDELCTHLIVLGKQELVPAKSIESVIGKIIAMGISIGSIAKLRTWSLYQVLESRSMSSLTEKAKEEFGFGCTVSLI